MRDEHSGGREGVRVEDEQSGGLRGEVEGMATEGLRRGWSAVRSVDTAT